MLCAQRSGVYGRWWPHTKRGLLLLCPLHTSGAIQVTGWHSPPTAWSDLELCPAHPELCSFAWQRAIQETITSHNNQRRSRP